MTLNISSVWVVAVEAYLWEDPVEVEAEEVRPQPGA